MVLPHLTYQITSLNENVINISLRNRSDIPPLTRTNRYENSLFPYTIKAWKELDEEVKWKPSIQSFNKSLFDFKRPLGYPLFGTCDKFGIRLLTKIIVEFSDLRDHRFNHAFNCESPICAWGIDTETSVHFFLRYPRYPLLRAILLSKISNIIHNDVSVFPDEHLFHILIYGSNVYNSVCNIRNTGRLIKWEACKCIPLNSYLVDFFHSCNTV